MDESAAKLTRQVQAEIETKIALIQLGSGIASCEMLEVLEDIVSKYKEKFFSKKERKNNIRSGIFFRRHVF